MIDRITTASKCSISDAYFIAELHNSIPLLLARIAELEEQNERIKQRVKDCAQLFHEYTEIIHEMEVIRNELQIAAAQAAKKKVGRRNRSRSR